MGSSLKKRAKLKITDRIRKVKMHTAHPFATSPIAPFVFLFFPLIKHLPCFYPLFKRKFPEYTNKAYSGNINNMTDIQEFGFYEKLLFLFFSGFFLVSLSLYNLSGNICSLNVNRSDSALKEADLSLSLGCF